MSTPTRSFDITVPARAMVSIARDVAVRVLGEERLRNAQANAWQAVCADRERADERAALDRLFTSR